MSDQEYREWCKYVGLPVEGGEKRIAQEPERATLPCRRDRDGYCWECQAGPIDRCPASHRYRVNFES